MKPPVAGWVRVSSREPVYIPGADGKSIAETLWVDVEAWQDPQSGQVFLDEEASAKLEAVKARYLGILAPGQLRELRSAIGVSQKGMAELLQLGEKSWTRWETGRERPSRSMNVLLCAVFDGKIDVNYLETLANPRSQSQFVRWKPSVRLDATPYEGAGQYAWSANECPSFAA